MNLRITGFRAIRNEDLCKKFVEGHKEVLQSYGVTQVTSAREEWTTNPDVYVVIAEDEDTGEVVGGARIHVAGKYQLLPIEEAVGYLDPGITDLIRTYSRNRTSELCGLWISRRVAGMGIGFLLIKLTVSVSSQLRLGSAMALCSPWTLEMFKNAGFEEETSIGNNGTFYYPKEDLIATAVVLRDPEELSKANESVRNEIFLLRAHAVHNLILQGTASQIQLNYNLDLNLSE